VAPSASAALPGAAAIGVRPTGTASLMTTSCAVEVRAAEEFDVVTV
jgi:hypothetical protein